MKLHTLSIAAGLLVASMASGAADVPVINNWVASDGTPVRSGFGLCWRNGFWTPETAHPDCDGAIKPVPPTVAAAPAKAALPAAPAVLVAPAVVVALAPAPVTAAAPVVKAHKVTLQGLKLFDFDKAVLKPAGQTMLNELVQQIQTVSLEAVVVQGHTDSTGPDAYNQKLSERRAAAVKAYLVKQGVDASRIVAEGKGEAQPVASNSTREGRAQNRRVEIEVIGIQK